LAGKQFIMYVGRALPHKNLGRLVEAYSILKQKYPHLILVLAGRSDAGYKRIGALVSEKRLAHSVIFTDYIEEGELRWLYENTAAYVFPSLSEGFGLPPLEAMSHGAPVVSSNATCLPEINGKAAHYFNPLNVKDMARAIDDVLGNKVSRTKLVSSGHSQLAKYSWRKMAEQTLRIYELALKSG
jgi:glycosyltransferase involved in cell wall biosynthesis